MSIYCRPSLPVSDELSERLQKSSSSSVSITLSFDWVLDVFDVLLVLLDLILQDFSFSKFCGLTDAFSGFLADTFRRLSYHSAYCSRLLIMCCDVGNLVVKKNKCQYSEWIMILPL